MHLSQSVGRVGPGCFRVAPRKNTHLSAMLSLILPLATPCVFSWEMQASTRVPRLGPGKSLFCFIVLARKVTGPAQTQGVRKYTLPHEEATAKSHYKEPDRARPLTGAVNATSSAYPTYRVLCLFTYAPSSFSRTLLILSYV